MNASISILDNDSPEELLREAAENSVVGYFSGKYSFGNNYRTIGGVNLYLASEVPEGTRIQYFIDSRLLSTHPVSEIGYNYEDNVYDKFDVNFGQKVWGRLIGPDGNYYNIGVEVVDYGNIRTDCSNGCW